MRRQDVVEKIKATMKQVAPTAQTILFGSEARGEANHDSDIDLLVLLDGDSTSLEREQTITSSLYLIEIETGVSINPIVMLRRTWENRPFKTPFYVNVTNEGIRL